jgi:hypothetical protein
MGTKSDCYCKMCKQNLRKVHFSVFYFQQYLNISCGPTKFHNFFENFTKGPSKHRRYSSRYQLFSVKRDEMRRIVTEYRRF